MFAAICEHDEAQLLGAEARVQRRRPRSSSDRPPASPGSRVVASLELARAAARSSAERGVQAVGRARGRVEQVGAALEAPGRGAP